ncbi:MAG: carbon-nitrogen hydrolase [Gemmatimonadota bacterium]
MNERKFTVGLVQEIAGSPVVAENVARAVAGIRAAHSRGANIICLQELFNAPYFCKGLDLSWFDLAEPIPGPTTSEMQTLAAELSVVLIVPLYERQAPGLYRNSAAVIDADGQLLGVYRKMHIPHDPLYEEKYYFAPGEADDSAPAAEGAVIGSNGFRVFRTRYANVGLLICWDQWYPEGARITSLLGADILLYPTAIGWHPAEKAAHGDAQVTAWRTIQRSHAIANGVYVAAPNRVGFEAQPGTGGIEFFGHSVIYDPYGRILAEAGTEPAVLVAECSSALIEETRRNWPFLRDRRVDAYSGLTRRFLA